MLIILGLYIAIVWVLFSKLKIVKWGWLSGSITVVAGMFILSVFMGLFNYLTPSGRFVIMAHVVEVTPNVSGQIVELPVKPNVQVKAGTLLFQIDPAPYKYKVEKLEASLVQARAQAEQLKANYDQATSNLAALVAQLDHSTKRLADIQKLTALQAATEFREQDTQAQLATLTAQVAAAKAAQQSAKLAVDSEINGVNTSVAQIQAQLDDAKWELEQTAIRAPADGYVTAMALAIGDRALPARSVMSFIVANDIAIVGMFSPNGFQSVKVDAPIKLIFDDVPGRVYEATVLDIPRGVGQGQLAVSGAMARTSSVGGASTYPARISIPKDMEREQLRLGMPGSATAFAGNAGVIGILMSIIVWINSYIAYL